MKNVTLCLILLIALPAMVVPQSRVFIAPMDQGFDGFLAAALLDNKVPVTITTDECLAEYVITGQAVRGQNKWYDVVFGAERDRNQGSIKLLKVSDKSVVWAGAAGDRSLWFGAWKSGGQKKVANRLARELRKEYFNKTLPAGEVQGPCATIVLSSLDSRTRTTVVEDAKESSLKITSTPEEAEILINNKTVGTTPMTLSIKSGEWTVTVRKSGFRAWQKFVRIAPGESVALEASL